METALEVARIILEYFGWDGDEIELSLNSSEQELGEGIEGKPLSQMLMASLADIGWITEDDDLLSEPITDEEELEVILNEYTSPEKESLETIISLQPTNRCKSSDSVHPSGGIRTPPPPPPPPPPPTPMSTPLKPVSQIIRENRAKRLQLAPGVGVSENSTGYSLPNMTDVLKGLGKVKLRSVERSPGGTPLRKPPISTDGSDHASIIAQALKKKFAHRRRQEANSPDANKENSPGSPFGTPPSSPIKTSA
ncbi:mitochondrial fission, partial [Desmophyllum pertusum]